MDAALDPAAGSALAVTLRLAAAVVAGLLLGLDREARGHAAGLRTHGLVALAAAATAALALDLHDRLVALDPRSNADPLRIVEGLVAAVGFIGGGIIIRTRGGIQGLTTATNIWACGVIGLACGAGEWTIALVTFLLAFLILVALRPVERRYFGDRDSQ